MYTRILTEGSLSIFVCGGEREVIWGRRDKEKRIRKAEREEI